ncbi:MAG: c-type cytochrome [Gammaproteobacteria bacterium]|nr:c-type cytochrome [Gammaproteobacteria bacterium]
MQIFHLLSSLLLLSTSLFAQAGSGEQLYIDNCSICHGINGTGGVGIPLAMNSFLKQASDSYLKQTIRVGRPGRIMPPFYRLSDSEISQIITHIRSWGDFVSPVWDNNPINGDYNHGLSLFKDKCAQCHGDKGVGGKGTGIMFSRPKQLPVSAPALNNQGFLNSAPDAMIKDIILHGRHESPMPSSRDLNLTENDVDDLVTYIRGFQQPQVSRPSSMDDESPIITYDSPYNLSDTIDNIKREILGKNFRLIRKQALDDGLVKTENESKNKIIIYFCNFNFLYKALAIDPRVGIFLPCRITVVEHEGKVQIMSINPKYISRLFNNHELNEACDEMFNVYITIMEDSIL